MPWRVASDWSRFFERGSTSSYFNLNTGANNGTGGFANALNGGAGFMRWRKRANIS